MIAGLGMAVPTAAVAVRAPGAPAQVDAERRQLTVMFCDVVGSTTLSTRHDPEDLRELIGDYHRAVAETVGRFDGFVAKYMGDGVLIYFGYPQAYEDDAEQTMLNQSSEIVDVFVVNLIMPRRETWEFPRTARARAGNPNRM